MGHGYSDDLAWIHDAGFGAFARAATPFVIERLQRTGIRDGLVVELGCGSGITAAGLLDAGYDVLGVDISPAMVRIARRRAPGARFRVASYLDVALPRCAAVLSIGECLNYLFDRGNGPRALRKLIRRVRAALPIGGLFILDFAEPGRGWRGAHHAVSDDWTTLVEYDEDRTKQRLTRKVTSFRRIGRTWRRGDEVHELSTYRGTQVAGWLRAAGFRVTARRGYGDFAFPKHYVALVARRAE